MFGLFESVQTSNEPNSVSPPPVFFNEVVKSTLTFLAREPKHTITTHTFKL